MHLKNCIKITIVVETAAETQTILFGWPAPLLVRTPYSTPIGRGREFETPAGQSLVPN